MPAKLTLRKKFSKSEFRKKASEIIVALQTEVTLFDDVSDEAKAERKALAAEDPFYFFQTYLPHYFSFECAPFHYELIDLLDKRPDPAKDEVVTPVAIAAPRDFAKSTITSFGYSLHQICNNYRHFIILGSDTEDLASDLVGYTYLELLYNDRIKCDYGELVQENWSVDDFVTRNDVRVKARGRGQRLRGLKHKQWRPDLVILDDMENDQNVKNPRIIKALLDWIKSAVYAGIDKTGNLFIIGTILARRSALSQIINAEEEPWNHYTRRLYKAIETDGTSLWPARFSIEVLNEQKKMMGSVAFNKEKMNSPIDEESPFQEQWFRYYHKSEINGKLLRVVGYCDPSSTEPGDDKAIITVGLDREEMIYYVLDAWIRKGSPTRMIDSAYIRHADYNWIRFGVEDNALKDFLHLALDIAAKEKGYYLPVQAISHVTKKEARIVAGLSHLVERGKLQFQKNQGDQNKLVEQLLFLDQPGFPDDGADALEGAVSLLTTPKPSCVHKPPEEKKREVSMGLRRRGFKMPRRERIRI